jgi:hypothetical protein
MDDNSNYTIFRLRKTNLTPQFVIQVSVPNYESERSYICALDEEIDFASVSTIFLFDFGTVRQCGIFFFLLIFLYDRLRNTIKYSNKIDYTLYTHPLHHPNVNLEYNDAFFSGLVFCNQKYLQVKT